MLRRNDDIAAAAEVIEEGFVGVAAQPDGLLGAFRRGAVQGDDGGRLAFQIQRNAEVGMGAFVALDLIADVEPLITPLHNGGLMHLQIKRRLPGLVRVADQFEVTLPQHRAMLCPILTRAHALQQVVP